MTDKAYLGIDPGLDGALVLLLEDGAAFVFDMPTLPTMKGTRELDLRSLFDLFTGFANRSFDSHGQRSPHVILEESLVMPQQGAVSGKTIGFQAGALQMALVATGLPYTLVKPAMWKKVMFDGLPKIEKTSKTIQKGKRVGQTVTSRDSKAIKAQSIKMARQLCPMLALISEGSRVESADRAEAFLLAKYGERLGL